MSSRRRRKKVPSLPLKHSEKISILEAEASAISWHLIPLFFKEKQIHRSIMKIDSPKIDTNSEALWRSEEASYY